MSARANDVDANYKRAVRRDATGWVVWNNVSQAWQLLPAKYSNLTAANACEYAAGFYGCGARQIRLEAPTP